MRKSKKSILSLLVGIGILITSINTTTITVHAQDKKSINSDTAIRQAYKDNNLFVETYLNENNEIIKETKVQNNKSRDTNKSNEIITVKLNIKDQYLSQYNIETSARYELYQGYLYLSNSDLNYDIVCDEECIYVNISGYDLENIDGYYIGITTDEYLFDFKITVEDLGKTIEINPSNEYVEYSLELEFNKDIYENENYIYSLDENNVSRLVGRDMSGVKIKKGNYVINYFAKDNQNNYYDVIKTNINIGNGNNNYFITEDEITKININFKNTSNYVNDNNIGFYSELDEYSFSVIRGVSFNLDTDNLIVTRDSSLNMNFNIDFYDEKNNINEYGYYNIKNIEKEKNNINLGTDFRILNNSEICEWQQNQLLYYVIGQLQVVDQYNNSIRRTINGITEYDYSSIVKLNHLVTDKNFEYKISGYNKYLHTIPNFLGQYNYTYEITDSLLPIRIYEGLLEVVDNSWCKLEDVNTDCTIDIFDVAYISYNYNINNTSPQWINRFDLNYDGIVDLLDLVLVSKKI